MQKGPKPPSMFHGRDDALDRLVEALASGVGVEVAVLYGLQGFGKSALAYAVAERLGGIAAHRTVREGTTLSQLIDALRRQLAPTATMEAIDLEEALEALARAIEEAESRPVVVVDDLHRLAECERALFLDTIGPRLIRGRLIVTSRERISASAGVYERVELHVQGLDVAAALSLWSSLDALHGSTGGFEQAYRRSGGSPFALRRFHGGSVLDDDPLTTAIAALDPCERATIERIASAREALSLARIAPSVEELEALQRLASRTLIEVDGAASVQVHDLVRERVLRAMTAEDRALRHLDLAARCEGGDSMSALEAAHHYTSAQAPDQAARVLVAAANGLIAEGAGELLLRESERIAPALRPTSLVIARARAFIRRLELAQAETELGALEGAEAELLRGQLALMGGRFADAQASLDGVLATATGERRSRPLVLRALATALLHGTIAESQALGELDTHCASIAVGGGDARWVMVAAAFVGAIFRLARGRDEKSTGSHRRLIAQGGGHRALLPLVLAEGAPSSALQGPALRAIEEVLSGHRDLLSQLHVRALRALRNWESGARSLARAELLAFERESRRAGYLVAAGFAAILVARIELVLGLRATGEATLARAEIEARAIGSKLLIEAGACAADECVARRFDEVARASSLPEPSSQRDRVLAAAAAAMAFDRPRHRALIAGLDCEGEDSAVDRLLLALAEAILDPEGSPHIDPLLEAASLDGVVDADVAVDLAATVRDVLDRRGHQLSRAVTSAPPPIGIWVIDRKRGELRGPSGVVSLASKPVARRLLFALEDAGGAPCSKEMLTRAVWGFDYHPLRHDGRLFVAVRRLRMLLEKTPYLIESQEDGYVLVSPSRSARSRAG